VRGGRDRREADDGRAAAGADAGAGIGRAALEEGGVELAQLDGLGDGRLHVLARGRGVGRRRRRGVKGLGAGGDHGHGGDGGGSKAACTFGSKAAAAAAGKWEVRGFFAFLGI